MSARSKKRRLRRHQHLRERQSEQHQLDKFRQKFEEGPWGDRAELREFPGLEKMSDVLEEFVAPFADSANTMDAYRQLLTLGVLAWNVALLPEDERERMIRASLHAEAVGIPADSRAAVRGLVDALVVRKELCFRRNRRFIVDFDLQDTGDGWHISVASTVGG